MDAQDFQTLFMGCERRDLASSALTYLVGCDRCFSSKRERPYANLLFYWLRDSAQRGHIIGSESRKQIE